MYIRWDTAGPDPLKKLKQMMVEHLLHIAPDNVTARPPVKKRKMEE